MDINIPIKAEAEAGIVAIRTKNGSDEVLIIERNEMKDVTIPKGHVEGNETLQETALREALEETGRKVELVDYIDFFEYVSNEKGTQYLRRVYCFLAKSEDEGSKIEDTKEVSKAAWLPIENAIEKIPYENVKVMIKKAYQKYLLK